MKSSPAVGGAGDAPPRCGLKPEYLIVQTAIGDYRQEPLRLLYEAFAPRLQILCGDVYFKSSVVTDHAVLPPHRTIRNRYLLDRRVLIQPGAIVPGVRANVAMLELNPRIVNVWIVVVLRRMLGRRTILWGHAWPRSGASSRTDRVRHVLRRLADSLLVYTETERTELATKMGRKKIYVAPNSLYTREQIAESIAAGEPRDLVWVGRIDEDKRPALALEGFRRFAARSAAGCRLVFVGDGPLRRSLEDQVRDAGLAERVVFTGWQSGFTRLREIYASAVCSVSSGYVGLSLIQSISFGIPMVLPDDEQHAPEIEAASEGFTSYTFRSGDAADMARVFEALWQARDGLGARREAIREVASMRYSSEAMAHGMIEAFDAR